MKRAKTGQWLTFGTALLVAGWSSLAQAASTLPLQDDFESGTYPTPGQSIIDVGSKGWISDSNAYAVVTNLSYTFTATSRPLTNSTHSQVVSLNTENSAISNVFQSTSGNTNIFIDMMYRIVLSDITPDSVTNQTDVQAAFFFDTNANLVVFHSKYYGDVDYVPVYSNLITTVTNAVVSTSDWTRITVVMDYLTDTFNGLKYFKVQLNGVDYNSEEGYQNADRTSAQPGPWFICANFATATQPYFSSISMAGTGFFDDFMISANPPSFGAGMVSVTASVWPTDGHGGSAAPLGPVYVTQGGSTNILIFPSNVWHVAKIYTNSVDSGVVTDNFALSNIQIDTHVLVRFEPDRDGNGVPFWWRMQYGLGTNGIPADDGDGIPYNDEWLASTDPTDSNSFFHVQLIGAQNGTNYIEWVSKGVDPMLGPYGIHKATNLVEGFFWANPPTHPRAEGTNRWWEATPAWTNVPEFFRVSATNNP